MSSLFCTFALVWISAANKGVIFQCERYYLKSAPSLASFLNLLDDYRLLVRILGKDGNVNHRQFHGLDQVMIIVELTIFFSHEDYQNVSDISYRKYENAALL